MTPDAMDWDTIKHTRANILIQGAKTETDACVSWLEGSGLGVRLIATTTEPLFDLVERGHSSLFGS